MEGCSSPRANRHAARVSGITGSLVLRWRAALKKPLCESSAVHDHPAMPFQILRPIETAVFGSLLDRWRCSAMSTKSAKFATLVQD